MCGVCVCVCVCVCVVCVCGVCVCVCVCVCGVCVCVVCVCGVCVCGVCVCVSVYMYPYVSGQSMEHSISSIFSILDFAKLRKQQNRMVRDKLSDEFSEC